MKNTHDHILDKEIANALQRHEVVPSAGVWSRLARHLPFVETITRMPWFYSARNVTIVALLVSLFSFGGGYFIANFTGNSQSEFFGISDKSLDVASYQELSSMPESDFSNEKGYVNHNDGGESAQNATSPILAVDNSNELTPSSLEDGNAEAINSVASNKETRLALLGSVKSGAKLSGGANDSEVGSSTSELNITLWDAMAYRLIGELPISLENGIKLSNFRIAAADVPEDFAIEPKKTRKFLGFNMGLAAIGFANANDIRLSRSVIEENKNLLSLQPASLSYRLSGELTLGQYFSVKTGLGMRDFHVASEHNYSATIPAPKFVSSGQPNERQEDWEYTYREGSVRTLQIPVLAGFHYDFGKLFLEAHVGKVFVKTMSDPTGKTFQMGDKIDGTVLLNTDGPELSIGSLNEISGGIGYAVGNRLSFIVSPTYQFSKAKISLGGDEFSPSAFGVSAGLKVKL